MLGEELELPHIEPKGKDTIKSKKDKYITIRQTGPDSLRHFKRTYKRALKRQVSIEQLRPRAAGHHSHAAKTNGTAPGRRSRSRKPTPPSST